MYDDERRDPRRTQQQLAVSFAADPGRAYEKFQAARAGEQRLRSRLDSLQRELDQQVKRLESEVRQARTRAQRSADAETAAREELGSAHAENERLRRRVDMLRNSRSFRLGHAVLGPVATARRALTGGVSDAQTSAPPLATHTDRADDRLAQTPQQPSLPSSSAPAVDSPQTPAATEAALPAAPRKLSDYSLDELLERLHTVRTPDMLGACINRLWYQHGAIERPMDLISEYADLLESMTPEKRLLVDRVRGTAALRRDVARLVPARCPSPAYVAERDRVLYCAYSTPAYHANGYSVRTQGIVSGMKQAGMDVSVVARAGYPWDIATTREKPSHRRTVNLVDEVEYVHLPEGMLGVNAPDDYLQIAADAYVREARLSRPSVIQAASNHVNGLAALVAARRLGVPFVYEVRGLWEITEASAKPGWEHTERYAYQADMETFVCREADAVLAITQEVADELERRGVDPASITLLPNGVNPRAIQPLPVDTHYRASLGIRGDVPVIGFAGSLVNYEGLDLLLQAARILQERGAHFQVAIAGGGGILAELKKFREQHGLYDVVRFLGRRAPEDIPRVLSCFDIVCCPRRSLPVTEMVSPLKPLEAFAACKPVVLSDVSPHRVLVGESHQRGLLATPDDPAALADALHTLLENPQLRADMGRAGRLWAVDERHWATLGQRVRDVHRSLPACHTTTADRPLSSLRIGLIADEFTTETLRRSVDAVVLDGEQFEEQLRTESLDFVFIESAWNGNGGQWHRRVGYYSEDEAAAVDRLFATCHELGLPTVFWNKEDPVHFERFKRTAARCDHVFTTDANKIGAYLSTAREVPGGRALTAASLSFYAQPAIHNPLPGSRPAEQTVAYAGTYYGDRYKDRSTRLKALLQAARPHGLAIYDRQLAVQNSPYRFPREFAGDVRGALPYDQVINSYKAHTANLNVNSVVNSPTMFSRRVVEIAASGGVVLSGGGRGVCETFAGLIPATDNQEHWEALLGSWHRDHRERLAEAWLQMRAVFRSHTVDSALTILARTASVPVAGLSLPSYGVDLAPADPNEVAAVESQSVLPFAVRLTGADPEGRVTRQLLRAGVQRVLAAGESRPHDVEWWGSASAVRGRTWAEDLLTGTRYGTWDRLYSRPLAEGESGRPFAFPVADGTQAGTDVGLTRTNLPAASAPSANAEPRAGLLLLTPTTFTTSSPREVPPAARELDDVGTVLVAGHDLKFARAWIKHLRERGTTVLLDEWADHAHHHEEHSRELLQQADTVFCEWGLGNAVWYSENLRPGQRLVVRVHAQELRRPYLRRIDHAKVSAFVFVGELMRDAAVRSHGVPRAKTVVIPNAVLTHDLDLSKLPGSEHVLGLVGMVPHSKRIDLAVDVLDTLLQRDDRFRLRVKGKRPEDYPWMVTREDEMAYYRAVDHRVRQINQRLGVEAVTFHGHGDDMTQWYRAVGMAISVSDLESFHLTLPDGAASGSAPVSLAWPGADMIYPRDWLVSSVPAMVRRIVHLSENPLRREEYVTGAREYTRARFDQTVVFAQLTGILGRSGGV